MKTKNQARETKNRKSEIIPKIEATVDTVIPKIDMMII